MKGAAVLTDANYSSHRSGLTALGRGRVHSEWLFFSLYSRQLGDVFPSARG